jgi:phosphate transport system protein
MTHLQEELKKLRETLSDMAHTVAEQLKKSISALFDNDEDLANEVIHNERRVNAFELKIDKDCEHIFALLTPVAHDMRFVFSTLKINSDLERIGDYAESIAMLVILGKKNFDIKLMEDLELKNMYDIAYGMMEDITKAYLDDDSKLARSVYTRDVQLNDINHNATQVIVDYCKNNPEHIAQALYLLSMIRKLERVGDHITNIAEDVIFYKEAKVLKHKNKSKIDDKKSE